MRETWVWSLGQEVPLEDDMATHSSILAWRIPMDRGAWQAILQGVTESNKTELLSTAQRNRWETIRTWSINVDMMLITAVTLSPEKTVSSAIPTNPLSILSSHRPFLHLWHLNDHGICTTTWGGVCRPRGCVQTMKTLCHAVFFRYFLCVFASFLFTSLHIIMPKGCEKRNFFLQWNGTFMVCERYISFVSSFIYLYSAITEAGNYTFRLGNVAEDVVRDFCGNLPQLLQLYSHLQ